MNVRCSGMSWCSCGGRCRDYHGAGFTVVGAAGALYYNLYDVIQHSNKSSELLLGGFCSSLGDSTCTQHICFYLAATLFIWNRNVHNVKTEHAWAIVKPSSQSGHSPRCSPRVSTSGQTGCASRLIGCERSHGVFAGVMCGYI